jgi:hypothetical protein
MRAKKYPPKALTFGGIFLLIYLFLGAVTLLRMATIRTIIAITIKVPSIPIPIIGRLSIKY